MPQIVQISTENPGKAAMIQTMQIGNSSVTASKMILGTLVRVSGPRAASGVGLPPAEGF